jgi:DNA-directed RNA polymerase subunit RPC12/RpoP
MTHYKCERCSFDFYFHEEKGVKFCPKCGQESIIIPPVEITFHIHAIEENEREHTVLCHYATLNATDFRRDRKFSQGELKVWYD